ncbi:MAG: luciferase family protein [Gemmatimonas sp.]|uniref:luciferase domain-containing protein n=1 Tax=Gemmatimonas sp. TaxID=1962908 RepID=UPI00391F2769
MATTDFGAVIAALVGQWEGVEVSPHRFGGVEFRVGRREIGHVHVDGVADLLVSVRLRRDLVAAGRALPHRTLPHSAWISIRLRSEHDVPAAVDLFRLNYNRLRGTAVRVPAAPRRGTPAWLGDRCADALPA